MPAYIIVNLEIHDQERFAHYRKRNEELVAAAGGWYVVRGGELRLLEGATPKPRMVIIGFPSMDAAQNFYDSKEYKSLRAVRHQAADSSVLLVEGVTL
jgi:uncharacterized protein (DUF1330 family)